MHTTQLINYFGRIVVINLLRDVDKYKKFSTSMQNTILANHIERFDAVDGKNLDIRIIDDTIITNIGRESILCGKQKTFGISLTYGALGCALSHYILLKNCVYQTQPYLIFEDDARPTNNFDSAIQNLIAHIQNLQYDILYLGLHDIPALNKQLVHDHLLYIPRGLTCGTWAMIITPDGAKKILQMAFPLSMQIDSEISKIKPKLKVYAAINELMKHSWEFGSSTQKEKGCETKVNL